MKSLLLIGALACLHLVSSQCTIESLDNSMVASLLARSLVAGTQSNPPTVTVRDYTIVCLAVSTNINQYRLASVVVEYDCTGTCPGGTTGIFSQVEFGCDNNMWSDSVSGTAEGNIVTPPAQATLQTPLRSDCQTCLNPGRESTSMEPNHCILCSGCLPPNEGLNMCTGPSQCCNVNMDGQCRDSCLQGTIADSDFICRASCADDPLPTALYQTWDLDNSTCTYVGCNATYTCNDNLTLSDLTSTSYQLRCLAVSSAAANWDVNIRTCSQRCNFVHDDDARASGVMIEYDPPGCDRTFGTTNCNAYYTSTNESASCNCTRNDTSGMISCDSLEVMILIMNVLPNTTTTPSALTTFSTTNNNTESQDNDDSDIIIIVVVVCGGGVGITVAVIAMSGTTYYVYKKKKSKDEIELNKLQADESKPAL